MFLSFCLLWICIFMKDIWYKCKYQSCSSSSVILFLISQILQQKHFALKRIKLTFVLPYLSKLEPTVTDLIFVIFSPHIQFWVQCFSTKKRVNRNKTFFRQNSVNCNKTTSCGVISKILHICHVEESPHDSGEFQIYSHLPCIEI